MNEDFDIDSLMDESNEDFDIDSLMNESNEDFDINNLLDSTDENFDINTLMSNDNLANYEQETNQLLTLNVTDSTTLMESCNLYQILKYYENSYWVKVQSEIVSADMQDKLKGKSLTKQVFETTITASDIEHFGLYNSIISTAKNFFKTSNNQKGLDVIKDIENSVDLAWSDVAKNNKLATVLSNLTYDYGDVIDVILEIKENLVTILETNGALTDKLQDYKKLYSDVLEHIDLIKSEYEESVIPPIGYNNFKSNGLPYRLNSLMIHDIVKNSMVTTLQKVLSITELETTDSLYSLYEIFNGNDTLKDTAIAILQNYSGKKLATMSYLFLSKENITEALEILTEEDKTVLSSSPYLELFEGLLRSFNSEFLVFTSRVIGENRHDKSTESIQEPTCVVNKLKFIKGKQSVTCRCGNTITGKNKFFNFYLLNRTKNDIKIKEFIETFKKEIPTIGESTQSIMNSFSVTHGDVVGEIFSSICSFHAPICPNCLSRNLLSVDLMEALMQYHLTAVFTESNNLIREVPEYNKINYRGEHYSDKIITKPCEVEYKPVVLSEFLSEKLSSEVTSINEQDFTESLIKVQEDLMRGIHYNTKRNKFVLLEAVEELKNNRPEDYNSLLSKIDLDSILMTDSLTDEQYKDFMRAVLSTVYPNLDNDLSYDNWINKSLTNFVQPAIVIGQKEEEVLLSLSDYSLECEQSVLVVDTLKELEEAYKLIHSEIVPKYKFNNNKVIRNSKKLQALRLMSNAPSVKEFFMSITDNSNKVNLFKLIKMHYYFMRLSDLLSVYKDIFNEKHIVNTEVVQYSLVKKDSLVEDLTENYKILLNLVLESSFIATTSLTNYNGSLEKKVEQLLSAVASVFYDKDLRLMNLGKVYLQIPLSTALGRPLLMELFTLSVDNSSTDSYYSEKQETAFDFITDEINWQLLYGLYLIGILIRDTKVLKFSSNNNLSEKQRNMNIMNNRKKDDSSIFSKENTGIDSLTVITANEFDKFFNQDSFNSQLSLSYKIQNSVYILVKLCNDVLKDDTIQANYGKNFKIPTCSYLIQDLAIECYSCFNQKEVYDLFIPSENSLTKALEINNDPVVLEESALTNYERLLNNCETPIPLTLLMIMFRASNYNNAFNMMQELRSGSIIDLQQNIEQDDFIASISNKDTKAVIEEAIWYLQNIKMSFMPNWIKTYNLSELEFSSTNV